MVASLASVRDERAVAEVARLSHAGLDAPELLRRTAHALHKAVPFTTYSAATTDPGSNLITDAFAEVMTGGGGCSRGISAAWFDRFYFKEAFDLTLESVRRGRLATTVEETTGGHPEQSACYVESMRPAGFGHKLNAVFVDRGLWGDLELYRELDDPGFSPREVDLVRRVAPHVGAGLKAAALRSRAETVGAAGVEVDIEGGPGVLVLGREDRILSATPAAVRLLRELGDLDPRWRDGGPLPVAVLVVAGALRQAVAPFAAVAAVPGPSRIPRIQVRTPLGRWLTLHAALTEATPDRAEERVVVIAPARREEIAWLSLAAFDLTSREEEVVKLVVGGLSTKQIGDRLFIAEHTVQRHLSNVFEKVGVHSRRELVKQLYVDQVLPALAVG